VSLHDQVVDVEIFMQSIQHIYNFIYLTYVNQFLCLSLKIKKLNKQKYYYFLLF